jgi:hypothetical protein
MAPGMSRRDRLILRLIMGVAFATFLFAIWALVGWGRARSGTDLPTTTLPNDRPASVK